MGKINFSSDNLSFEAKLLYLREQLTGISTSVSLYKEVNVKCKPPLEFYEKLIISGWGDSVPINQIKIYYFNDKESKKSILFKNQKLIKEKDALFTLGISERENSIVFALSINHYLADEQTLKLVFNLIKIGTNYSMEKAIRDSKKMRENYIDYIKKQVEYSNSTNQIKNEFKPIKLSNEGFLSWNIQKDRICVSREINSRVDIEKLLYYLLRILEEENTFSSGNIICSSKLWSSLYNYDCLGMVTGLIPIKISEYSFYSDEKKEVSLETKAYKSKYYKGILDACISSELFINTSVARNIASEYILDTSFPVGIEIDRIGENVVNISFEGKFCSANSVEYILDRIELILKGA